VSGNGDSGVESLYPFLYEGKADLDAVLDEVRRSTIDKANEIVGLREEVLRREGDRIARCAAAMAERFAAGGKLLAFGNGGSSSDAQDVATTLLHPAEGPPLPALCLTNDVAVVTALSNDIGFEVVFARQVAALGTSTDIAMGISTSGNSENLIQAFEEASRRGLLTVGLAGYEGGKMAEVETIDHLFVVRSSSVHRIQEAQTTIFHVLCELARAALPEVPARTQG
jgi:D-sedoheptulose 7-phosphate isomerase